MFENTNRLIRSRKSTEKGQKDKQRSTKKTQDRVSRYCDQDKSLYVPSRCLFGDYSLSFVAMMHGIRVVHCQCGHSA